MTITKCDICKKVIKDRLRKVEAGLGWFASKDICFECGKPVVKFLLQKKLITKSEIEKLKA